MVSAALLAALPTAGRLTPNDPNIGLLLRSIGIFALGLSVLASTLFVVLLFFRDVPRSVKLRALADVSLPYIVGGVLWLLANSTHPVR